MESNKRGQKAPKAPLDFYFYTSDAGLQEMNLFGYIKAVPLLGVDAHYGQGVYGTPLPPTRGEEVVALNNWGSYWKQHHDERQQIDRTIHFIIPPDKLTLASSSQSILIHVGAVDLRVYKWQVWMLPQGVAKATLPQPEIFIEIREEGSDSDEDAKEEEEEAEGEETITIAPTGEVFFQDGTAVEESSSSSSDEEED